MGEEHLGDLERKAEGEEIEKPGLVWYRDTEHNAPRASRKKNVAYTE